MTAAFSSLLPVLRFLSQCPQHISQKSFLRWKKVQTQLDN